MKFREVYMMREKNCALEEESFVIKAQQGDPQALAYLLDKYHNLAHYIALKVCHNDADAEDIVQESFIEVHRSIANLQEPKFFKAWLNKIIFSKCTKLFRSNKDMIVSDEHLIHMKNSKEHRIYMLPDSSMKYNSDKELLMACIKQLPEKMQMMIIMMYFEQMSIQEISIACDIPEGTVKSRLNYAKGQLKIMLMEYERTEGVKVDFKAGTLEATLALVFANEAKNIVPSFALGKGFKFRVKGHLIEPSMLLMATLATCISVAGAMVVLPYIKEAFQPVEKESLPQEINKVESTSFPETMYKGEMLKNEKQAYKALTETAHCYIELEQLSVKEQEEAIAIYHAMKQHGGAYYELLYNRNFLNEK